MQTDDLYQELKNDAEEEQKDHLHGAKLRFSSKFTGYICLFALFVIVICVVPLSSFIVKRDIQSILLFGVPAFLILFFIVLFQNTLRKKYIKKMLKNIPTKSIDDIINERINQEIIDASENIESCQTTLKETEDDLRQTEEKLCLMKQLQWRYVSTLADLNPQSGEWYSVLLVAGGFRFVAYVDALISMAMLSDGRVLEIAKLFDPKKLNLQEAKDAVKKEITDIQNEKPADIKDQEKLQGLLTNAKDFYEKMFPKI